MLQGGVTGLKADKASKYSSEAEYRPDDRLPFAHHLLCADNLHHVGSLYFSLYFLCNFNVMASLMEW